MPSENVTRTLVRILDLMRHLPEVGTGLTAAQLHALLEADGYSIDKRTVERDLNTLAEAYPTHIWCNNGSKPYGWRWHKDAKIVLTSMGITDALSLSVIEDTIKPLLPAEVLGVLHSRFAQARRTLDSMASNNKNAAWAHKVRIVPPSLPLLPPEVNADALREIQDALLNDEQVEAEYRSASTGEAKPMTLNPLALVQRGPVTYLVATAFKYHDPRLFAMHRFSSAKRSYLPSEKCEGFDIDAYIAQGGLQFGNPEADCGEIELNALVEEGLARILAETPLAAEQKLEQEHDGRWRLRATLHDTMQLEWWLLSQCTSVEVVEPSALRERIAGRLHEAASRYPG